jgi:hypothetical protein
VDYVLFDLETEPIRGPLDLERHIPGITVAVTLGGGPSGEVLRPETAAALVDHLVERARAGCTLVTWNGAGFDFRVLAQASGRIEDCIELAWDHVDMMFWFHCVNGFSIGLSRAAEAVGSGKTPGMSGADAPRLWAQGQYAQVVEYAKQDVRATAAVYEAAVRGNELCWVNSRGRISRVGGMLCSVREANDRPPPDTSWMRQPPWPRTKFVGWMQAWR